MNHGKTSSPTAFFDQLHEMIEQHLQQCISTYLNLLAEVLNNAIDGQWSVAECLEHLNTYHRHYLPLISAALSIENANAVTVVKRGWLGDYFIKMMDPARKVAKYKAAENHLPPNQLDAHQVVAEFICHQENLMQLLKVAVSADLNGIRIPTSLHPLIKLRLGDTLSFLIVHDERHIRQADRSISGLL